RPPWAPPSSRGTPSASLADLARPETLFATHSAGNVQAVDHKGEAGPEVPLLEPGGGIVNHGQQLLAHSLDNAFPGEQGQPVFQGDANKPIVLNPLANTIKAKQTLHLLLRINCSG
ncbi:hypothetical protein PTTG_30562, partial [Puccinia triticina 1-1 BBBD Race 1]